MTVREVLGAALEGIGGSAPRLDAEVLLCHVLGASRAWLYANPEAPVSQHRRLAFDALIERRRAGEPVAYLTGRREFWSLDLELTPDVLIPRPETELLVEIALEVLPQDAGPRVADLGTGSGAIAVAIAVERPLCEIHATESDARALEVARRNAARLAPGRIRFHRGNWTEPLPGRFDLILSNPPYIAEGDPHLLEGDCRFEPRQALDAGRDALGALRQIVEQSPSRLADSGVLAVEHAFDQAAAVRRLLERAGFSDIESRSDLAGLERVSRGRKG